MLHIYARHLVEIDDALDTFFDYTESTWNEQHERFETYNETHGLYWFWLDLEKTKVMIITCFKKFEEK